MTVPQNGRDVMLATLTDKEHELWMSGYSCGYVHGIARGREHERDEAAAFFRAAVRAVHTAAESAPRDRAADEARAASSRRWWARKRGER
jgi:hypothetical protein